MSLRRTVVAIDPSTIKVTEFCASHGVSTWWFWMIRRRYREEGEAALEPRSRAPRTVANKTPAAIEELIVAKRKELVDAGLDAGPASIAYELRHVEGLPSEATIWRRLKARGFVADEPAKAPKRTVRRFDAARANECWQLDDTTWSLTDGTEVKILNILDDHSRLLVASKAMTTCTGANALATMAAAAAVLGWPERILSDNAKAFRNTLATAIAPLGVAASHSRPHHPQTNGKVERFHQTLKKRLAVVTTDTLDELQSVLDAFRHHYNHQRSHRGIERRTPAQTWTDAPKSGPADRPIDLEAPAATRIHESTVTNGAITAGRGLTIALGATHNQQRALTIVTGDTAHVFIDGHLTRTLTIDPTRTYQPLHDRPGRPTHLP